MSIESKTDSSKSSHFLSGKSPDSAQFAETLERALGTLPLARRQSDDETITGPLNGPIGLPRRGNSMSDKGKEMLGKLQGDEYAPYTDGKPPLVTIDDSISKDDIEYVSDEYVGGGGVVLSYWFGMLEVRTKSGDKFLVQKDITPELYEKVLSLKNNGETGSLDDKYEWSSADIPKDDKSWLDQKKIRVSRSLPPTLKSLLPPA